MMCGRQLEVSSSAWWALNSHLMPCNTQLAFRGVVSFSLKLVWPAQLQPQLPKFRLGHCNLKLAPRSAGLGKPREIGMVLAPLTRLQQISYTVKGGT